jgi:hypothetical protein
LRRAVPHIALALMLFMAQGAYVVHPLLHDHHHAHLGKVDRSASAASPDLEKAQDPDDHHAHCPICDWLAHFHGCQSPQVANLPGLARLPEPVLLSGSVAPTQPAACHFFSRGPPASLFS